MTAAKTRKTSWTFWLAALVLVGFGLARVAVTSEDLVGEKAPELELTSVDGETVTLASFEGKVVLLDFWAVWCGPCETSMPFFQELQDKYGEHGLEVVGVHVDDRMPAAEDVKEFLDERGVSYLNLMGKFEVDDRFLIYAMPTTYLIDRKGTVAKQHVGFNPGTTPAKLEHDVREMLGLE